MNGGDFSAAEKLALFLNEASRVVVFTGAGISTESGIPDYRSKGGLWDRFQPITLQEFLASEAKRKEYWSRKKELYEGMCRAEPNEGHRAIAELDRTGRLVGVITQNIDGLHQLAGLAPAKVLELHGTQRTTRCLDCREQISWEETHRRLCQGESVPRCHRCGGLLKPDTISFGQNLDPSVLGKAYTWAESCDLFCAVGSTLVVEPAASIPRFARERGAKLIILNLTETPLDDWADLLIRDQAGPVLRGAVRKLFSPDGVSGGVIESDDP